MALRAVGYVRGKYTRSVVTDQVIGLYRELLSNGTADRLPRPTLSPMPGLQEG
jgi:hypothetical protein